MGLAKRLSGTSKRDAHAAKALADAQAAAGRGLQTFTVTVHSADGGAALLPRLVPFVVDHLQAHGFAVVHFEMGDWTYRAHLTVTSGGQ